MKYPALGFFVLLICGFFAVPSSALADDYAGICATMVDGVSTGKSVYLTVREGQLTGYVQTGSLLGRIPIKASVRKSGKFRAKIAEGGGSGFVSGKVKRSKIVAQGYVESQKTGRVRLFINVPPRLLRGNLPIVGDYTALHYPKLKSDGNRLYVKKSADAGDEGDYYDMFLTSQAYFTWNHVKITNNEGMGCIVSSYAGYESRSYFYFEFQSGRVPGVNRVLIGRCEADGIQRGAEYVCLPY